MKKNISTAICALLILIFSVSSIYTQGQNESNEKTVETIWKGFKRIDFQFQKRNARIVFPKNAEQGKPWIWRARFPDWHTDADSILLSKGFHLVYVNTDGLFGSPLAMDVWDDFYTYIRQQYQLQQKVALMGVSRGGLFVYNWAKRNTEKVSCIYAEAPVCDFKSWPAGFGKGIGAKKEWNELKKVYGFKSDNEALQYKNNPINGLENLAKARVPILHMVCLSDRIVPYFENTKILVEKYLELGGSATVVPCSDTVANSYGHHFTIETPQLVADFIAYHSVDRSRLRSESFHTTQKKLKNVQINFLQNKFGRIAFLGGSITSNPGWRDSLMIHFKDKFPETKFEFINAGLPSMGSTPAAFRLQRDVLSKGKIDLLFVEAAVNDATNGRTELEQKRAMEGIIRHFKNENPAADVVMMHFVDPEKIEDYNNGIMPDVIQNHNQVAQHYNIPVINLAQEVAARIKNKEFTWEDDFKNLHPSPFGQNMYAQSMKIFLDNAFLKYINEDDKIEATALPDKLDKYAYDKARLIEANKIFATNKWRYEPNWKPKDNIGTRHNYTDAPMLVATYPSDVLKFSFSGTAVGIAVAAGPDAGIIEYRIDGGAWQKQNLFTNWSNALHLPWYYTLAAELSEQKHLLEIKLSAEKDERSIGNACLIRYFFVNGEEN